MSRSRASIRQNLCAALAVCATVAVAQSASAADWLDDTALRGSLGYARWDGFYFGGQAGYTYGSVAFGTGTSSQIKYILANSELEAPVSSWTTLPDSGSNTTSYGGFVGYNLQWGEVTTGVELNYNHMGFKTQAQDSVGPLIVPGADQADGSKVQYAVSVASVASISISDLATARATAGWAVDRALPYGFVGLAVGQADISRFASVTGTKTVTPLDPITGQPDPTNAVTGVILLPRNPQSESKTVIAYGYTAGLGINVAITPNMFVRAEWEYIQFPNISDFRVAVNSARVGLGLRF